MLIACVKVGDKYGPEYVTRLRDGVARNYTPAHDFVCFTDKPIYGVRCEPLPADLPGWWAKVGLFKLKTPLLYFDLDVVITGDLSDLLFWKGFGIIDDWWSAGFNSSVMRFTGNEYHVWEKFQPRYMQMVQGDQDFITGVMNQEAKTFPPEWFPSFKADRCFNAPPAKAKAVIMHGYPKPHQCGGWVRDLWK